MTDTATITTVTEITVTVPGDMLRNDWQSPVDNGPGSLDSRDSLRRYADTLADRIETKYPHATVTVDDRWHEAGAVRVAIDVVGEGQAIEDMESAVDGAVSNIMDDLWADSEAWVVLMPEVQS